MWERDQLVNGNILICRSLFVSLCLYRLESLSSQLVHILIVTPGDFMKATGENLRRFLPSARILVAAELKPTRFLKEAVATDSQVTYRYCTEQPLLLLPRGSSNLGASDL